MNELKKSGLIYRTTLIISGILLCAIFMATPIYLDDLWYLSETPRDASTFDAFLATLQTCIDRRTFDTGRLSNLTGAIFLSLFPKWVFSIISSLMTVIAIEITRRLCKVEEKSVKSILIIGAYLFVFPWFDYMFGIIYALNYVWAIFFAMTTIWILVRTAENNRYGFLQKVLIVLVSFVTGMWHEGFSVPLLCGFCAYLCISKPHKANVKSIVLLTVIPLVIGLFCIISAPALWVRMGVQESHLFKGVWWETAITCVGYNCFFYVFLAALMITLMHREWRTKFMASDVPQRAIIVLCLVCSVVATAIYFKYFNGARTGTFSQMLSIMGLICLYNMIFDKAKIKRWVQMIVFSFLPIFYVVSLSYAMYMQYRLRVEYFEIVNLFKKSKNYQVYYDVIPVKLGIDMFKPSYKYFNTVQGCVSFGGYYSNGESTLILLPCALEKLGESNDIRQSSRDKDVYLFHNKIILKDWIEAKNAVVTLYLKDGREVSTRCYLVHFTDSLGRRWTYVRPNIQVLNPSIGISSAKIDKFIR